jgi:hypothetical protein
VNSGTSVIPDKYSEHIFTPCKEGWWRRQAKECSEIDTTVLGGHSFSECQSGTIKNIGKDDHLSIY